MIPANAPVSADDGLAVWLANRHTINDFPDKLDPTCYVVLDHQARTTQRTADRPRPAARPPTIDQLASSGRHVLFDATSSFVVWTKARHEVIGA